MLPIQLDALTLLASKVRSGPKAPGRVGIGHGGAPRRDCTPTQHCTSTQHCTLPAVSLREYLQFLFWQDTFCRLSTKVDYLGPERGSSQNAPDPKSASKFTKKQKQNVSKIAQIFEPRFLQLFLDFGWILAPLWAPFSLILPSLLHNFFEHRFCIDFSQISGRFFH